MSEVSIIYGIHAVSAALNQDATEIIELMMVSSHNRRLDSLRAAADQAGISIRELGVHELDTLSQYQRHQGVVARIVIGQAEQQSLEQLLATVEQPFLLILDGIQDPHNLGACLRTADAAGVDAVIVPRDKAVGVTPVVRKVACGAAESMPLFQVTNLARTLRQLQQAGLWIIGADERGDKGLYVADLRGPLALVLGAEGKGLRRLTREHCDMMVSIPMAGQVSSLNVSVATGVCLFEVVRQRQGL
jgi:23S rRNA (guanosine2251-2'-O)-methyltransferase